MPISSHYECVNHPAWNDAVGALQSYLADKRPDTVILLGDSASRLTPYITSANLLLDHTTNLALYLPGYEHFVGYRSSSELLRDVVPKKGTTILLDDFSVRSVRSKSQIIAEQLARQKIWNAWVVVMVGRQLIPGVTVLCLNDELVSLLKGH